MKLVQLKETDEEKYKSFLEDWQTSDKRIVPFSATPRENDFKELVKLWQEDETKLAVERGFVPSETWFLEDKGKLLGAINIRHYLNDHLKQIGGHIGYGVVPSERKKGYAMLMMTLIKPRLKALELEKVLLTCDLDNAGSNRVIQKSGGLLEVSREYDGKMINMYWIKCV